MATSAGQIGLPVSELGAIPQQSLHQPLALVTRNSTQGEHRVELQPNKRQLDSSDVSISERPAKLLVIDPTPARAKAGHNTRTRAQLSTTRLLQHRVRESHGDDEPA